jgi:hypothetical protein
MSGAECDLRIRLVGHQDLNLDLFLIRVLSIRGRYLVGYSKGIG